MSFWQNLTRWVRKSSGPDWGTLERYLAWAFGGGASASGIVVNPQTAMQAAAVYACVKVLAESVGMLPLNLYHRAGNVRTLAPEHDLWTLLHDQPNEYQSSVEFFELMVTHLNLRGNAYAYVNRARSGRVVELLPLHPDMVRTEMTADFRLRYHVTMPDGGFKVFGVGELWHVRGLTVNGWLGISPIAYAREAIGLALATEKFGGQLFRNGAKMGGVLEHPGKISDEAYKRIKSTFDEAHSGENAHKTAVLEEGMKFSKVAMTGEDAQFLETRKYQRSEIAAIFRVPPHMIGDLERATFSNIEQQSLEFATYSLAPWLKRIEKSIKRDLFSAADKKANLAVRFDVSGLIRGDAKARADYYSKGILDGWLTRNEARLIETDIGIVLNPLQGLDVPLMPLNMTDGSDDPDEHEDEAEGEKPGSNAEPAKESTDDAQKLLAAIANLEPKVTVNVPPPINHITVDTAPRPPQPKKIEFIYDDKGEVVGASTITEE